jgi:hypothetical protein
MKHEAAEVGSYCKFLNYLDADTAAIITETNNVFTNVIREVEGIKDLAIEN